MAETVHWGRFLGTEWIRDFPDRMYSGGLTDDGSPQRWDRDFNHWIMNAADDGSRGRTTRVMRRLRRVSPRAYEVLLRALVHGESLEEITKWLNDRAVRNAIPLPTDRPTHYRIKDTMAMFIAGIDYARNFW